MLLTKDRALSGTKPKSPRVRRIPSAERRVQLLEAARQIIRSNGVGALTMSSLADAVGVTKPIVYKHFKNSEDVIVEILKLYAQGSVEIATDRVKGARSLYEFMDRIIDSLFEYIRYEGALVRNITNGFSSSSTIDAYFLEMQNRSLRVYRHLLLQQGVPENRSFVAAYALMAMINSTIMEFAPKSTDDDEDTLKEMVRGALRVLIHGRGTKPRVPIHVLETEEDG